MRPPGDGPCLADELLTYDARLHIGHQYHQCLAKGMLMAKGTTKKKVETKRLQSPAPSPYVVFISHSSYDTWIANVIADKITALGAQPWLDKKELAGGDVIREKIMRGIRDCKEAIVLISPKSVKSQWVAVEIGAVSVLRKRVTPILNHVSPDAMAPMEGIKAIDLNNFEDFLGQLKARMAKPSQSKPRKRR
jgi:hypothetical protein